MEENVRVSQHEVDERRVDKSRATFLKAQCWFICNSKSAPDDHDSHESVVEARHEIVSHKSKEQYISVPHLEVADANDQISDHNEHPITLQAGSE